jgi:LysM repeat protein
VLILLKSLPVIAQQRNASYEKYISQYSRLAIQEREKYRIPASITLAQAILESGAGQSVLARQSNTHFGIKCHTDWKGDCYYKDAEIPNECFRKYKRVEDSYEDHSRFLAERSRYEPLFRLSKTDYAKWAKGLQTCGYATDKKYATKLITLIETYELYRYDTMSSKTSSKKSQTGGNGTASRSIGKIYGLKYVTAGAGDSFASIAADLGMKVKNLMKYNEAPVGFPLREGDVVYLEMKKKKADKPYFNHQVKSGESMYSISQRYGIRVNNLYKLNNKDDGYVPEVNNILKLR